MSNKKNQPKANKPVRREDKIEKNELPYDPNINKDDKQALHDKGLSMDQGQDKPLENRRRPVDFAGKDLDIPGREEVDTTHKGTDIPDEANYQFNERGVRRDADKSKGLPNPDREVPKKN